MAGSNLSPKKRSLEDLFRPPLDLMFHGTFQNVRHVFSCYTDFDFILFTFIAVMEGTYNVVMLMYKNCVLKKSAI